ncbi:putative arabinose efflux protein [Candidatus Planktophila versatilis]|uniref:MFS transporter n=1 Tax=Candidatus Planktophila versatilis TaxID=1884905 RepID=UPI000BACD44D|nr:MFS transporter [Candidatus Planktophila versatilis]ASY18076.1 putative arabinose efflux protein [Candidatus Planktophila versatilis]
MAHKVKRDSFFWTIALQGAAVNIFLGAFGPSQPLLRADQGTSLTIAGLHGTAMGIASIMAGLSNSHLVHRFGRSSTGWIGLIIFSIGLIGFVAAPPVELTILAALVAGFGVSVVINNFVTSLTGHYGKQSAVALTQANAIGSIGYVIGTLTVGLVADSFRDQWRIGILAVLPFVLYLFFFRRIRDEQEHVPHEDGPQGGKLSGHFWISWFGFFACIASEFAISFWAAALIRDRTDATPAIATLAVLAFGSGMAIGRWYGPILLKQWEIDAQLKIFIATQFFGFAGLWFSHNLTISFFSLLVTGIGVSSQFTLSSLRLIGLSDGRPDLAMGKNSLAAGSAIGLSPFVLGILGDHLGISRAYLMVPVLMIIAYAVIQFIPSHAEPAHEL